VSPPVRRSDHNHDIMGGRGERGTKQSRKERGMGEGPLGRLFRMTSVGRGEAHPGMSAESVGRTCLVWSNIITDCIRVDASSRDHDGGERVRERAGRCNHGEGIPGTTSWEKDGGGEGMFGPVPVKRQKNG